MIYHIINCRKKLKYNENDFYEVSFLINYNKAGPINYSVWESKELYLQIKDYNLSFENKSYLNGSFGWDANGNTPKIFFIKPRISIKALGEQQTGGGGGNSKSSTSENLIGYCNGQTYSELQDSRTVTFPSVKDIISSTKFINEEIKGSDISYVPIVGTSYIEYSFEFLLF